MNWTDARVAFIYGMVLLLPVIFLTFLAMIINSIPSKIHLTVTREHFNEKETFKVYVNGTNNLEASFSMNENFSISEWLEIPREGKG